MGILGQPHRLSAITELLSVRDTARELHAVIAELADRVESHEESDIARLALHADLLPHPGRALENRSLDHLQVITEHAGAANADDLPEQLDAARQRFYARAGDGDYDADAAARLRQLRQLAEDAHRGVHAPFVRYAQTHLDDAETRLTAMKEIAADLHGVLTSLTSEEPSEV